MSPDAEGNWMIYLGYTHAIFMCCAFLFLLLGALFAALGKKKKWWLRAHRALGVTGISFMILGLCAQALQIALTGRSHFQVPHSYIGIITVCLGFATPILGQLQFTYAAARLQLRLFHIWCGRFTIVLMLINIIIGLSIIGII